ncbi:YidB family protein [Methylocystis echinoides]|jgi:uncharacterized protein YidB (DUF937 family)|uniref:Uncharacterized protein n=1 Tax=Methylocystis echinoides TaxID=29468 RepID=A0A9W6LR83_9HYPH|nr:YidB family protein [Methylocystis echinoides]GLI92258.1 hypothetical protein LMG27198_12500 [Methylocystis echinoides]
MNWIARLFDLFSFRFAPASAAVERRADADQAIRLLQDYIASKGGVAETIKRFEKAGFAGKVRSWRADGANLPINSVEALQLIGWKDLRDMSARSGLSIDRLRDILADQLPGAIRRACAA